MSVDFQIPLSRNDLMSCEGEHYVVKEVYSVVDLSFKIEECEGEFSEKGPTAILDEFDTIYSVLRHFNEAPVQLREKAWGIILDAFTKHISELSMIIDPEGMDYQQQKLHLATVKMLSYLLTQLMELFEAEATKPCINTDEGRKGKKKSAKKKAVSDGWAWDKEGEHALCLISQLLQLDVNRLWDPPIVEEEFVNVFSSVCYKFLENSAAVKLKETKEKIFYVLGTLIKKYDHGLGASLKIIQLLQHFEHLVSPLAQAVESFVIDFGARRIVADIIREIGRMDSADLSRDTSGTRAFSQFVVELAEKQPSLVLPNISLLVCHLDGDSYSMRNGVLGVIGEIVIKVLSKDDLEQNLKNTRDKCLDRLEDHIHDVHAFVRSKVLQIWHTLCSEKAIPLSRLGHLMDLVIGRLQDKSSQVRKYAIQLIKTFLCGNPFAAKLSIDEVEKNLEKENETLKAMLPPPSDADSQEPPDKWSTIAPGLKEVLIESLSASEEDDSSSLHIEEDLPADQVIETILKTVFEKLDSSNFKEAVAVFKMAGKKWPECFQIDESDENEDSEMPDEAAEKQRSEEETLQLSVNRHMVLFEGVFRKFEIINQVENEEQENENADDDGNEESEEIKKQKLLVQYLEDCLKFATQLQEAIKVLCQLLGSKTNSDILETIEFFISAHNFGLTNANQGIRKMLALVWSRDAAVKEAVVNAYEKLYIKPAKDNERNLALSVVNNLTSLTIGATLGDLTSMEELLKELYMRNLIPAAAVQLLWQRFSLKTVQTSRAESRAAVLLIGMFAGAESSIVKSNIDVLVSNGLGPRAHEDFLLAMNTCNVLLKLVNTQKKAGDSEKEPFRFPEDHAIFERLSIILIEGLSRTNVSVWSNLAMPAINVIYQLAEHPDKICSRLIKSLVRTLLSDQATRKETDVTMDEPQSQSSQETTSTASQDSASSQEKQQNETSTNFSSTCSAKMLARVVTVVGHVAFQQLVHMDVRILGELKRRHRIQEREKEKKLEKTNIRRANQSNMSSMSNTSRMSTMSTMSNKDAAKGESGLEDEMGIGGAAAEDAEAEFIRNICEKDVVTGDNLLALFGPLLINICSNPKKYASEELRAASCLALSKFMLVSSEFCEPNLQLLFTILEKSSQPIVRANGIIALGDLTFRFPNLIEPWTGHLYERLKDKSTQVRQTAVTVLTHLVLNDMVKVKGQISEMALCLEDDDKRIADLTRLFFTEFSRKGNALYNVLPDIISRLSDPECKIEELKFRNIMKWLLQFIQKDKQSESLVEKLCHRFRVSTTRRQWHDLSYCLALLPYNEKCFKRLQENFACFQDMLMDEKVYACFLQIVSKSKKFVKPEIKVFVEEFEQRLTACHTKGVEDEEGAERAAKASEKAANTKNRAKNTTGKGRKKTKQAGDDYDDDSETDKGNKEFKTPTQKKRPVAGRSTVRRKRRQQLRLSSEEEEDDLFD